MIQQPKNENGELACGFTPCASPVDSYIRWGKADQQQGNYCREHTNEVWDTTQTQIAAGICFWIQGPPQEESESCD